MGPGATLAPRRLRRVEGMAPMQLQSLKVYQLRGAGWRNNRRRPQEGGGGGGGGSHCRRVRCCGWRQC